MIKLYKIPLLLLLIIMVGNNVGFGQYPPSEKPDRIILTWQTNPENSQAVTWRTDTTISQSYAELIISDASPNMLGANKYKSHTQQVILEELEANFHSVNFENLLPGEKYMYRVGQDNNWSEWFQFQTAKPDDKYSFLYLGDAQNDISSLWSRTIRQAFAEDSNAAFALHAGDFVDYSSRDSEWGEWFYGGSWIFASLSQVPVVGNHEYTKATGQKKLSAHWRASFTLPKNGPAELEEAVYYFDYKNTRFIIVDSRDMLIEDKRASVQAGWVKKLLQDNSNQWTIVSHHHPIYSARGDRGDYAIKDYLLPLYKEFDVDLVLQGHHHSYARGRIPEEVGKQEFKGPVFMVSNSGPKMYDTNFDSWMERVATDVQMYQKIEVDSNQITVSSFLVNGRLYDKFFIQKDKKGRKIFREEMLPGVVERLDFPTATYGADVTTDQKKLDAFNEKAKNYKERRGRILRLNQE